MNYNCTYRVVESGEHCWRIKALPAPRFAISTFFQTQSVLQVTKTASFQAMVKDLRRRGRERDMHQQNHSIGTANGLPKASQTQASKWDSLTRAGFQGSVATLRCGNKENIVFVQLQEVPLIWPAYEGDISHLHGKQRLVNWDGLNPIIA